MNQTKGNNKKGQQKFINVAKVVKKSFEIEKSIDFKMTLKMNKYKYYVHYYDPNKAP